GDCTCPFGHFTLSVFPFVDGETLPPHEQTDDYARRLASLLAALHRPGDQQQNSLPQESFHNPFEAPIQRALRAAEAPGSWDKPFQARLRELLLDNRANVEQALAAMRDLLTEVRQLNLEWVVTHGDPNWANILVAPNGDFCLLDWEDLALGPPERDLVFFSDRPSERFELFLRQYLADHGRTRLHSAVFAFYGLRWSMQEIAEYSMAILFRSLQPAEAEHAWAELKPYVPVDLAGLAAARRQVEALLSVVTT